MGNETAKPPIFIVGSSRSGTTLLSSCLRQHPAIHITNETHYFDDLRPRLLKRLNSGENEAALREEAVRYFRRLDAGLYAVAANPDDSEITPEAFHARAQSWAGDIDSYFDAYCQFQMERHGHARWGEKTPRHVYQLNAILERFPTAKVVFKVRDPRAVAASYQHWKYEGRRFLDAEKDLDRERDRAAKSYHPLIMAMMWRSGVRTFLSAQQRYGDTSILRIRYEDLVADPQPTLEALCTFLDEPYEPTMLDVAASNSSFNTFDRQGGINTASVERWREKLAPGDIASIQRCCASEMTACGYAPAAVGPRPFGVCMNWLTLCPAVIRATLANKSRIGNLPAYLWRRFRGAAC